MSIAFIGDLHAHNSPLFGGEWRAGLNERARQVIRALDFALKTASTEASKVVLLGDVFSSAKPPPELVAAVMQSIADSGLQVYLMAGNHDMSSTEPGHHALAPFVHAEGVAGVIDRPTVIEDIDTAVLCLPWSPEPIQSWLPRKLDLWCRSDDGPERWPFTEEEAGPSKRCYGIAMHVGLFDGGGATRYGEGDRDAPDAIGFQELSVMMEKFAIDYAVSGHWHTPVRYSGSNNVIYQIGALVPTGFQNLGSEYGRVVVGGGFSNGLQWPMLPMLDTPGPRFYKVYGQNQLYELASRFTDRSEPRYVSLHCPPQDLTRASVALRAAINDGMFTDGIVVPDSHVASEQAHQAALAASEAAGLRESIARYVLEAPSIPGADRDEATRITLELLGE